jgi:hypothetical protein
MTARMIIVFPDEVILIKKLQKQFFFGFYGNFLKDNQVSRTNQNFD